MSQKEDSMDEILSLKIENSLAGAKEKMLSDLLEVKQSIFDDRQRLNDELNILISKNKSLNESLSVELEACKNDVSDKAIDKTISIVRYALGAIAVLTAFVVITSWLGFSNLGSFYKEHFREEVEKWLAFDSDESAGKTTLEDIRTRAILDSHMIRYSRSYSDPFSTRSVNLNALEVDRLVQMIIDPKTSYADFYDALRLVSLSRNLFGSAYPEDDVGKAVTSILSSAEHDNNKKIVLFDHMKKDRALLPYSREILKSDKYDESWKNHVFENVSLYDEQYALEYAKSNINKVKPLYAVDLASYLAREEPLAIELNEYFTTLLDHKKKGWLGFTVQLALSLLESEGLNPESKKKVELQAADLFTVIFKEGAYIDVSDSIIGARNIELHYGENSSVDIKEPARFFENLNLLSHLIERYSDSLESLTRLVHALQIRDGDYYIVAVQVKPKNKTRFEFADKSIMSSENFPDTAWLKSKKTVNGNSLWLAWRDTTGIVHEKQIMQITNPEQSAFYYTYDNDIIRSLSSREINNLWW